MKEKWGEQARVVLLPIDAIDPSPFQARTNFKQNEIKKLAVSILQNGLLQPVSVRPAEGGRYQLIAGERRLRACKLAQLQNIPALVYHFEDEKTAALSLLENLQREQLNPFEQARALRELLDLWDCTQEAGARRLGIAQPTLANKLRLLTLTLSLIHISLRHLYLRFVRRAARALHLHPAHAVRGGQHGGPAVRGLLHRRRRLADGLPHQRRPDGRRGGAVHGAGPGGRRPCSCLLYTSSWPPSSA